MTTIRCARKINFSSGHRVFKHEGKCANPHGHSYCAHIFAERELDSSELDSLGRVIDFSVLKEKIGGWIELNFDHTFLVFEEDLEMIKALDLVKSPKKPFICPFNPTAENIAHYLLTVICPEELKGLGIKVTKVIVYESENCYAESQLC
jgi:6-pyruvoyltetrahydropterin/6-carboxytetrahydropterin synthase